MYPTISAQDGLSVCTSHYAFMVSQSLSEALIPLLYWFAFLFVEKVHKTSGLTRSWKKNTFSKGLKMTPFSACFWLSPTFLLLYGVQGNFFVKRSFNPDLNDLWIRSKTLKRPGASEKVKALPLSASWSAINSQVANSLGFRGMSVIWGRLPSGSAWLQPHWVNINKYII